MHILFVCTGNTCRSSMAEAILKDKIKKDPDEFKNITVGSAGIAAFPGDTANPNAVLAMNKMGIKLHEHRARQLSSELVKGADLILTMTDSHKRNIILAAPYAYNKVKTLKEFIKGKNSADMDISDPFGMDLSVYEKCAAELSELIDKLPDKL